MSIVERIAEKIRSGKIDQSMFEELSGTPRKEVTAEDVEEIDKEKLEEVSDE